MKKREKKFVLAALALLAITGLLALAGCKNDTVPEPTRYTVKFDKGDNSEYTGDLPADITVVSGTKLTAEQLKVLDSTDNYIFEGWYDGETKAEGGTYTVTKDVTLVAKWRDRGTVASVNFSPAGGTKFYLGESIAVSLTSEEGATIQYHLGDGSWKDYDAGRKIQVTGDTTITAKATKEGLKPSTVTSATYTVRKLEGITVTTPPERTVYSVGQSFDPTGMVVTATYEGGKKQEVTGWTTDFGTVATEKGLDKPVTVSYTEEDTPKTTTFTVTVFPAEVEVLTDYESPNNTGNDCTYVAFGEWPQTEAVFFNPTTAPKSHEIFDGNYYVEGNDKYVEKDSKYYKVEPIVWRVLTTNYTAPPEGGTVGEILLLAEKILTGGIPYYDVYNVDRTVGEATIHPNNYEHSAVRAWLNGLKYQYKGPDDGRQIEKEDYFGKGFLQTAFTQSARGLIADTTVDNSAASTNPASNPKLWENGENPYASDTPTKDKIFLLSEEEATTSEYGFAEYNVYVGTNGTTTSTRIRVTTDYAYATGANQSSTIPGYGGWWWLRSPYYGREDFARDIYRDGDANDDIYVDFTNGGVVPALSISLQ